jgi:hypothetical protein
MKVKSISAPATIEIIVSRLFTIPPFGHWSGGVPKIHRRGEANGNFDLSGALAF